MLHPPELTNSPSLSVVVLTHSRRELLSRHLPPLLEYAQGGGCELIVADAASEDGTPELLRQWQERYPALRLVLSPTNPGCAGGLNLGLREVRAPYAVCLDDDACVDPADLSQVPGLFESHPQAGILAFRVRHARTGQEQNPYGEQICPVANFHGAAHAFRCELFAKAGYYDEECTYGAGELEMSLRAHAAGYLTLYVPSLVARHDSARGRGELPADRRESWVYHYCRVLHKYFPRAMAARISRRALLLRLGGGLLAHGPGIAPRLLRAARQGRAEGLRHPCPLPPATVEFYRNPDLGPIWGDRLLWRELTQPLRRRRAASS